MAKRPDGIETVLITFWSEPGEEGMIFEVSSGARNPPAGQYVDLGKQELLRDHGFDIGGNADNFRKIVGVEGAKSLRPIAREAIVILCSVLGYDGTRELSYKLHLATHSTIRHVFDAVSPETLKKMMAEWHFPADLTRKEGQPQLIESRTDHGPFWVLLVNPSKESSSRFHTIALKAVRRFDVKDKHAFTNSVNQRLGSLQASLDADGDLVIEAQIVLRGGVTAEHVQGRFEAWRMSVATVADMV
jgi:Putative bacterial sensory transduction regulator